MGDSMGRALIGEFGSLEAVDPEYVEAAIRLYRYPADHRILSQKEQALVLLSTAVLVTQLDPAAIAERIELSREAGASFEEIRATIELASVIGLHSISFGLPRLQQVMDRRGLRFRDADDEERQQAIEERRARGYRGNEIDGMLGAILGADPAYFERFVELLEIPWVRGDVLDQRTKQLICIAIDACCSHLYEEGLVRHYEEAFDAGVTPDEIVEVLQICSTTGLRSLAAAFAALEQADAFSASERDLHNP